MKRVLYILIFVGFTLTSLKLASHHYRYDLFQLAIEFESEKAQLTRHELHLDNQHYFYLSRAIEKPKETVILLHGFSANKENWLRFAQQIPSDFQVIALDLLGHGEHPIDLSLNYSIENQTHYLNAFIEQVIKQPVHLVGNSMGGAISSLYAATYPEKVRSLMLISPAGVHQIPSEMDKLLTSGNNPLIANTLDQFHNVVDFVMEQPPFIPDAILDVQAERSVDRYSLNQKIFTDIRADLTKNLDTKFADIQAPTVILWGAEDRVINVQNIQRYAELIPNSKPSVLSGIGHLAMIEAPEISAQSFLALAASVQ